ncbi:hypothetical protein [uncultured Aquimarina sp.]|uniref:hypothetical protein n=1 Tax=uncultured Aquimarina sp. TaxID=575652 RepID=UPI0026145444|nr:hypothetical protein [uncultured Aquimarina sp.]
MREEFALQYAERRAKERGFDQYRIVYREFMIPPNGMLKFQANNEIWFVTYIAWGLIVKSDYGRYDNWYTQGIVENVHEHADRIEIINTRKYQRTIRFLQVILKTKDNGSKE